MIEIFKTVPTYNFIRYRKIAFTVSTVLVLVTLASVIYHRGFNVGIDFSGGTIIQYQFENPVSGDIGKIRSIVNSMSLGQAEIKTIGPAENNEIQISVKKQAQPQIMNTEIQNALKRNYPDNPFILRLEEKVGPKIGAELTYKAIIAVLVSLFAIIIYMWVRFNIAYSIGGAVALFHDVIITLCFFSLTNREITISIIAALLTIIGYSINDTIVIFDRIREKLGGKLRNTDKLITIINTSINETLSRTIITSGTVFFVLIAFSFFSGQVIRDFSLAMLVGGISGVYSTVYIASPVVIWWSRRFGGSETLSEQKASLD